MTVLGLNYPPEPTGIAPYTGAMSRGLTGRGLDLHVLTAHPHYPAWKIQEGHGGWSRRTVLDGVDVRRLLHYVPRRPSGLRRLLSELTFGARLATTRWASPDAVVAVSPALFASAMALARARVLHRKTPFIVWVQDLYSLGLSETGQGGGVTARVMKAVERWLLRTADHVVVIHDRFARRVHEDFAVPLARITVIRNWTHLKPAPRVDREAARARFGWGDETVVLHAGNMGKKQGLDNVVEAARFADRSEAAVRFVMLGNGGERERLEKQAEGVESIQFMDPLDDEGFAHALQAADVLLVNELPGVAEMAVPSKLTSYFSAGRPVLAATDPTGITAEEIRAANAGVVVPAGDPEALLQATLALGADPARAAQLGSNGLAYRREVLDEATAIRAFRDLLTPTTTTVQNA